MKRKYLLVCAVCLILGATSVAAHSASRPADTVELAIRATEAALSESTEEKARNYFTDLPVVTQDGKRLRFFTDLLKDKVVLITMFYTECIAMCPIINQKLSILQDLIPESFGKDVFFVSVSLDPETDTPEVLKDYAAGFEAREGWTFVTGEKADLKTIARRLGQVSDNIGVHSPYLMIGDVKRAKWKKFRPGVPDEAIAAYLLGLVDQS